ncbi:MAG: tetratricopeptide repeat protein [Fimbriimonadaceae bacterium]|nr:tetratricopeptide repeat protein [Fimbriimonadaceae bacterium]
MRLLLAYLVYAGGRAPRSDVAHALECGSLNTLSALIRDTGITNDILGRDRHHLWLVLDNVSVDFFEFCIAFDELQSSRKLLDAKVLECLTLYRGHFFGLLCNGRTWESPGKHEEVLHWMREAAEAAWTKYQQVLRLVSDLLISRGLLDAADHVKLASRRRLTIDPAIARAVAEGIREGGDSREAYQSAIERAVRRGPPNLTQLVTVRKTSARGVSPETLLDRAQEALAFGEFDLAQSLLVAAERATAHLENRRLLTLGRLSYLRGDYGAVLELVRQVDEHHMRSPHLTLKAMALSQLGHYVEAEALFGAALSAVEDDEERAFVSLQAAWSAYRQGNESVAYDHLSVAEDLFGFQSEFGLELVEVLVLKAKLAHVRAFHLGHSEDNSRIEYGLLLRAYTMAQVHGEQRAIGQILQDMARVATEIGEIQEAHDYAEQSLEARIRFFGTEHLETAKSYSKLGEILLDHGSKLIAYPISGRIEATRKRSLECMTKALDIRQRDPGEPHPSVVLNHLALGDWWRSVSFAEAVAHYQEAVRIAHRLLPEGHPNRTLAEQTLRQFELGSG